MVVPGAVKSGIRDAVLGAALPASAVCFGDDSNLGAGMWEGAAVAVTTAAEGAVKAEPLTGVPHTILEGAAQDCAVVVAGFTRWLDCCRKVRAACEGRGSGASM